MSNDRAILGALLRELSDTCRVCGCHGDSCTTRDGERCVWMNSMRTLCSNEACVIAAAKSQRKHKFEARRKRFQKGREA